MDIQYRFADHSDMAFLVQSRLDFLNCKLEDVDYMLIKQQTQEYFEKRFRDQEISIILAEENNQIIATGILFFYDSVPSRLNPYGKNAYITSMYVRESYRRRGIANSILNRLIQTAKNRGVKIVSLSASEMGKTIYEKYGFKESSSNMYYEIKE